MTDREKLQAMQDANWTPAVEYWRQRAEAAGAARDLLDTQVKALRVMLTEARDQLDAEWNAAIAAAAAAAMKAGTPVGAGDGFGTYVPGTSAQAAAAIRALRRPADTAGEGE